MKQKVDNAIAMCERKDTLSVLRTAMENFGLKLITGCSHLGKKWKTWLMVSIAFQSWKNCVFADVQKSKGSPNIIRFAVAQPHDRRG